MTEPADTQTFDFTPTSVRAVIAAAEAGRAEMWNIPVKKLKVIPGFNLREDTPANRQHIETLARSMLANGYFKDKPLAGYAGKDDKNKDVIFVVDGHCRLEAVAKANEQGAKITSVPVILKPGGTSAEDLTVAMAAGNNGKPFEPLELAKVCQRLQGYNMERKTICERIGITPKYFGDLMTLLAAPVSIRKLVASGKLSATEAVKQIKEKGADAAPAIEQAATEAEAAGKKKITRKTIEKTERPKKEKTPAKVGDITKSTVEYVFRAGQRLDIEKIEAVKNLAGGDWWALNEKPGKVDILADVEMDITITRRPTPPAAAEDDEL